MGTRIRRKHNRRKRDLLKQQSANLISSFGKIVKVTLDSPAFFSLFLLSFALGITSIYLTVISNVLSSERFGVYIVLSLVGTVVISHAIAFCNFIGKHRKEERIRSLRSKLILRKAELTAIMEGFPFGLFIAGPGDKLRYVNQQLCLQLGANSLEITRRGWLYLSNIKNREREIELWKEAIQGSKLYEQIIEIKTSDGIRWLKVRAIPIKSRDAVVAYLGVSIDITDSEKREEGIKLKIDRIEETQEQLIKLVTVLGEQRRDDLLSMVKESVEEEGRVSATKISEASDYQFQAAPQESITLNHNLKSTPYVAKIAPSTLEHKKSGSVADKIKGIFSVLVWPQT